MSAVRGDVDDRWQPPEREPHDRHEALARTRRGFLGALAVTIGAALIIGLFWLIARDAPSAGRDPNLTPPAYVPTRSAPTATPSASREP